VKVSDELVGRFEYGTGVNVRLLYGEWNFGSGKLLVGQTYTPVNMFYSNQVYASDNDLLNYGGVYGGRNPALQLTFGGFKIAALPTASAAVMTANTTLLTSATAGVNETNMPKLEASYKLSMDNWHIDFNGGYNSYEVLVGTRGYDVDSYVAAFGAGVNFGAAYLQGNIWMGQNVGPYGLYNAPADDPVIVDGTLEDNDGFGWLIVAGYKVNDMISLEIGYAQATAELDMTGSLEDDVASYYVQSTIAFAPGVFIVPEIGYIDNKDDITFGTPVALNYANTEGTETLYYGIKWQINF
jgi:hypothetical protein